MLKRFFKKIVVTIITLEARVVLWKYKPRIIAITGSVGKTSTKEAIYAVLRNKFFVWCSPKSFNSEIGVPLAVMGLSNAWGSAHGWLSVFFEGLALIFLKNHYPKLLVIEVGTDRPGDIQAITRWLHPDVVVFTRFGDVPVHVEFFGSREALLIEKSFLVTALKPGGTLVLNADDLEVLSLREKGKHAASSLTFGFGSGADVRGSHLEIFYSNDREMPLGVRAKIDHTGRIFPLKINGTIGMQYGMVALAAFATGIASKINAVDILNALEGFAIPQGRQKLIPGIRGSLVIDDSYNSSPVAVWAALDSLKALKVGGRKIVVLGDMLELGKESANEHRKVGEKIKEFCDIFVTVGPRAETMWEEALKSGMDTEHARHFKDAYEARAYLKNAIQPKDVMLVKGSQSMRLERIVEHIMAEPELASELLVRQEKEWKSRPYSNSQPR